MSDDGREIAAAVIEGASETLDLVGIMVGSGSPGVGLGLKGAAAGLRVLAGIVRRVGPESVREGIEDLQGRISRGEGTITTGDLAEDDAEVRAAIAAMYDGEHPDDSPLDITNPFADDEESP